MIAVIVTMRHLAWLLEIIGKMLVRVVIEENLDPSLDIMTVDADIARKKGTGKYIVQNSKTRKKDLSDQASVVEGVQNVLLISTTSVGDAWILDSSCAYHICPNWDWFTTYQLINGGIILMENNTSCKVVGIGTIRIKSHDGIMRTLSNVRHIPDLKKNMISLGTLDAKGYSLSFNLCFWI